MICGAGGGGEVDAAGLGAADPEAVGEGDAAGDDDAEAVGDGDAAGDKDAEAVGDGEAPGDKDADAVGDGEAAGEADAECDEEARGEGDGDSAGVVVADGAPVVIAGDVVVSAAGMMAGCGPEPGEEGLDTGGCVWGAAGAGDTGAAVVRVGRCTGDAADEGRAEPFSAKLTAADAASTPAATPVAVTDRRSVLFRRGGGGAGRGRTGRLDASRGRGTSGARVTSGSHPVAGCAALAAARTSSAVGRWPGSLARQCSTSGRRPEGSGSRFGGP